MAESLRERVHHALADLLDPTFAALRQQLADRFASELETAARDAAARAAAETAAALRQSSAEALHLEVRRILRSASVTEVGAALLEAAAGYCGRAALLVHRGDLLSGWRTYTSARNGAGAPEATETLARAWAGLQVPVAGATAFSQAIESREAIVSLSLPDHLSPALVQLLDLAPEEKVYLFPLSLRQTVVGVVYADGRGAEGVLSPAIELLCAVAEAALEAISSRPPAAVRGQGSDAAGGSLELPAVRPAAPPPAAWSELTAEEREQHLRAQRFARVLVADLQLYRAAEIREAKKLRNIYERLHEEIDKSREVYHRKFAQSATAGVDYFHVELVRTLADNEEELLGPDYPGPLVAPVTPS